MQLTQHQQHWDLLPPDLAKHLEVDGFRLDGQDFRVSLWDLFSSPRGCEMAAMVLQPSGGRQATDWKVST